MFPTHYEAYLALIYIISQSAQNPVTVELTPEDVLKFTFTNGTIEIPDFMKMPSQERIHTMLKHGMVG